jgi:hypothetical protein
MPALLETRMFRLHWGNAHSNVQKSKTGDSGIVQPNELAMEDRIAATLAEITDGNWEIKASLPVTASEYSTQLGQANRNAPAIATSFAAPFTDGVILLCQRARNVDEATHLSIMDERRERQERLTEARREVFMRDNPVTEKRKLIGGKTWQFRGRDYQSREAAEAAQSLALDNM